MQHKHQAWIFEIGPDYLLFKLPMYSDEVEDVLQDALKFVKNITLDMEEEINLYMENRSIFYKGETTKCILVYAAEFPIGVLVFNANMTKANRIGPYSTRDKRLYTIWHSETPEA